MPTDNDARDRTPPDAHVEGGLLVYTAAYHLKRGSCCGSGCRHCPYEPRHVQGTTVVATTTTEIEQWSPGVDTA